MAKASELIFAVSAVVKALESLSVDEQTRVLRCAEAALAPVAIIKQRGRPPGSKNKPTREEYEANNAELCEK